MEWHLSAHTMAAMCGGDWRDRLTVPLEVAVSLCDGPANAVHRIECANGAAWCSVAKAGVATCFGVEVEPGALGARSTWLTREEFFALMPYGSRKGWIDARSKVVRDAVKAADPVPPYSPGEWVVLVSPRDVHALDPMTTTALVAKVATVQNGEVETVQPDRFSDPISVSGWIVRDFRKYTAEAPHMWTGRNWFTFQFASKAAGGRRWAEERRAAKPKGRKSKS